MNSREIKFILFIFKRKLDTFELIRSLDDNKIIYCALLNFKQCVLNWEINIKTDIFNENPVTRESICNVANKLS